MPRVLILYYSSYGHIEQVAEAVPADVARDARYKLDQAASAAAIAETARKLHG